MRSLPAKMQDRTSTTSELYTEYRKQTYVGNDLEFMALYRQLTSLLVCDTG
jgi:hypothetical protein